MMVWDQGQPHMQEDHFTTAGGNASGYIARWGCENALADPASAKSAPDGRLVNIIGDTSTAVLGAVMC